MRKLLKLLYSPFRRVDKYYTDVYGMYHSTGVYDPANGLLILKKENVGLSIPRGNEYKPNNLPREITTTFSFTLDVFWEIRELPDLPPPWDVEVKGGYYAQTPKGYKEGDPIRDRNKILLELPWEILLLGSKDASCNTRLAIKGYI